MKKKDYSNAIHFLMRNRHGRYQEVVFSSILTNFMDPASDFGEHGKALAWLLEKLKMMAKCEVLEGSLDSEVSLDFSGSSVGRIDILYDNPKCLVGIEVKINDDAARNEDSGGQPQLLRYARGLKERAGSREWRLVFVPPSNRSRVCAEEFGQAHAQFPDNLWLWPWLHEQKAGKIPNVIDPGIAHIMARDYPTKGALSVSMSASEWIRRSVAAYADILVASDPGRFPNKVELEQIPEIGPRFETLFEKVRRFPNPTHTTVGIPYGTTGGAPPWASHRNNCVYRIRTTQAYYELMDQKEANLPKSVAVELWPEVYVKAKKDLAALEADELICERGDSFHLDGNDDVLIRLYDIQPKAFLNFDKFFEKWDNALRAAFGACL